MQDNHTLLTEANLDVIEKNFNGIFSHGHQNDFVIYLG